MCIPRVSALMATAIIAAHGSLYNLVAHFKSTCADQRGRMLTDVHLPVAPPDGKRHGVHAKVARKIGSIIARRVYVMLYCGRETIPSRHGRRSNDSPVVPAPTASTPLEFVTRGNILHRLLTCIPGVGRAIAGGIDLRFTSLRALAVHIHAECRILVGSDGNAIVPDGFQLLQDTPVLRENHIPASATPRSVGPVMALCIKNALCKGSWSGGVALG